MAGDDSVGEPDDPAYCAYTSYDAGTASGAADLPATGDGATGTARRVWDALYGVEDPEMPVSVVDLGLVYGLELRDGRATVRLTLTYTGCPAREMLLGDVREAVGAVDGVEAASVELVWSPPWSVDMVTPAGREALREFGVSV